MGSLSEDDELDALLIEAEVKEDYLDLGIPSEDENVKERIGKKDQEVKREEDPNSTTLGKKYKIGIVRSDSAFCLKYIGSGASICLRTGCTTNHGGASGVGGRQSFTPPSCGVLLILKNGQVAFASPALKMSSVEGNVVKMWEGQTKTLEEWQSWFQASNQGANFEMSYSDIKSEAQASKNSDAFRTPAKKKRVLISEPAPVFVPYVPHFGPTGGGQDRSAFKRGATSASVADSMFELDSSLGAMSKGLERVFEGTATTLSEVASTADMGYRIVKGLESIVGSIDVMDESELACPTVWGTLATIGAEVIAIRERKVAPAPAPVQDLRPFKQEVKLAQDGLAASMTKLGGFTRVFARSIIKRISGAEAEIKKFHALGKPASGASVFGDEYDSLLADAGVSRDTGDRRVAFSSPSSDSRLSELEDKLDRVLASNEDLERRLAQILAESEVDAVKFAGLGLRSVEEVHAWVTINFPKRSYGLIIDAYLLFDLIADEGPSNQKDLMTEMKRRDELDIGTEAEGQALSAFLFEVPRLFHTTTTSLQMSADNASHFSKVPTHKAWSNTGGLKKTIEKRLAKLKRSLREVLASELVPGTIAYVVAVEALEKTISWIGAFNTYLDTTYEHLHVEVGFTSARAWALTTQLGNRIFSDLHTVRVGTTKAMGKGPESICPAILWSVFRTHDKMAGFEDANFENHPSIASEFVKFLATNTGIEGMAVLQEEVASLKSKMKDAEKQSALALLRADKASSGADTAKKATEALTKRVDKL